MAFSAAASLHAGLYRPIAEVRGQGAGILGLLGSRLHLRAKPGPRTINQIRQLFARKSEPALESLPSHLGWTKPSLASPEATNTGLTSGW